MESENQLRQQQAQQQQHPYQHQEQLPINCDAVPNYEETIQELVVKQQQQNGNSKSNNGTIVHVQSNKKTTTTFVMLSRSNSRINVKKTEQSFIDVIFELIGVNGGAETTKENGALILLGVMLLVFIISVTGFFFMWCTEYYNNLMLSKIILADNTESAERWMNPPSKYDTLLKVHIFNYTNMPDYLAGRDKKIKVQDVGPLTYQEHTTRVNVSFNSNYTVTFRDHRTYRFLPEKSGCGEHDAVHVPNVPLLSAAATVPTLPLLKRTFAWGLINKLHESPFKTLTAHELLWGYRDNILAIDFTGNKYFGLLKNRNGTSLDSLQLNTGEDDLQKYSIITQFNGNAALNYWEDEQCNRIDGSDPSMYSPHLVQTRDDISVFLTVLCRRIPLQFDTVVNLVDDIEVLRYRTPMNVFGNPESNPNNACYCRNTKQCLPSGVINATKCFDGAPIFPSFPHFFSGDPVNYKDFEGIEPVAAKHQTYADIHPRFAFPVSGALRIQINIMVHKNSLTRNKLRRMPDNLILPLIWIEITSSDFTDEIIDMLYISTVGLNTIQCILKYGTLLVSITSFGLIVGSFYCINRRREEQMQMQKQKTTLHIAAAPTQQLQPQQHCANGAAG